MSVGIAITPAANENAGTNAKIAKPCAITPPTLLHAATQPVARPRSRTGKHSEVYGNSIEITALVPTTSKDTETSGLEIQGNVRFVPSKVAMRPTVVIATERASARLVLHTV